MHGWCDVAGGRDVAGMPRVRDLRPDCVKQWRGLSCFGLHDQSAVMGLESCGCDLQGKLQRESLKTTSSNMPEPESR